MNTLHTQEKKQFRNLLHQEGFDHIDDRVEILGAFLETEKHVTARDIEGLLKKKNKSLDSGLIAETLESLVSYGFATVKLFDDTQKRYEHRHIGLHHDHMICTKCRKIIEFTNLNLERQQIDIAASHGFHMLFHKMEMYGICSDCIQNQAEKIPLSMAKPGERLVILEYAGGANLNMRLLSMGLRVGDNIEVIVNSGRGQLVIALDYTRLILGRGVAQKIMVMRSQPKP